MVRPAPAPHPAALRAATFSREGEGSRPPLPPRPKVDHPRDRRVLPRPGQGLGGRVDLVVVAVLVLWDRGRGKRWEVLF
jgi:hypothetical protein